MADFSPSPKKPGQLGVASLGLTLMSWMWFAMCFTAREQAWWNSLYLFFSLYALAAVLAVVGLRSVVSVLALLLAPPSLGLVGVLAFHR